MLTILVWGPHLENHWSRNMAMGGGGECEVQVKVFEEEDIKNWENFYKTQNYDCRGAERSDIRWGLKCSALGAEHSSWHRTEQVVELVVSDGLSFNAKDF